MDGTGAVGDSRKFPTDFNEKNMVMIDDNNS